MIRSDKVVSGRVVSGRVVSGRVVSGKKISGILLTTCNLLVLLSVLLMILPLATATGIRPAKTTIFSEETSDYVGQFWVVNNDHQEFSVGIATEGEMSQYITLQTKELHFRADDDALPVLFEIHLPKEIAPGESTAYLVIEESIGGTSGGGISSKILLKHKITIQGSYPDKYLEAKLNFHEEGKGISFVSEVTNLGKLDLHEVKTIFYVNDKQQQQQVRETEKISLAKKENKLITATLPRDLFTQGEFEVSAVTTFDGQKVELTKSLVVGEPVVEITYFDKYFIANKINQYSLDLMNKWNKEIKNVFVDVEIKKDNKKIDTFRTRSIDLPAEMMKRISDYLDAKDKAPGKYTFEMMVSFWNLVRQEQKPFVFESEFIAEEDFKQKITEPPTIPVTGAVVAETTEDKEEKTSLTSILFWVLLGMLISAALGYIGYRYIHRGKYEGGGETF